MLTYRVYRTDANGKIRAGEWLEALNDDVARARALDLCKHGTPAIEIWQGGRRVFDWTAK